MLTFCKSDFYNLLLVKADIWKFINRYRHFAAIKPEISMLSVLQFHISGKYCYSVILR